MSGGFTAKYADDCAECGEDINPGDRVVFASTDELVHVRCPDVGDLPPVSRKACSLCFQTKAVNGACGCF